MTEWRDIPGYEGRYQASDDGQIRSVHRTYLNSLGRRRVTPSRVLAGANDKRGYLVVALYKDATTRVTCRVHQCVCLAFHGLRPFPEAHVRHLDGNSYNNAAANLRWGTPSENQFDRLVHGTQHNANKTHCKQGHEFSPDNTIHYVKPNGLGMRRCRTCTRIWGNKPKKAAA